MTHGLIEGVGGFLNADFVAKTANYQLVAGDKVIAEHATPATRLTFTLPVSCPRGAVILLKTGLNAGGFRLAQNTGQIVLIDGQAATTGGSGYWDSDSSDVALALVCVQADTKFEVIALVGRVKSNASAYRGTADTALAGTIARRGALGVLEVGAPTVGAHATTKTYVDGLVTEAAEWMLSVPGPGSASLAAGTQTTSACAIGMSADKSVVILAFNGANTAVAPVVFKSIDGGRNFVKLAAAPSIALPTAPRETQMSIFVQDANTFSIAYIGSANQFVFSKTTNGGTSWTTNSQATSAAATTACVRCIGIDSAIWSGAVSTTSIIYGVTTNAGSVITTGTVATETVVANLTVVAGISTSTFYVFWQGNAAVRFAKTTNSGSSWTSAANVVVSTSNTGLCGIAIDDTTVVIAYSASSTQKILLQTTNSGGAWSSVYDFSTYGHGSPIVADTLMFAKSGTSLVAITRYPVISSGGFPIALLESLDNGATWTRNAAWNNFVVLNAGGAPTLPIWIGGNAIYHSGTTILTGWGLWTSGDAMLIETRKMVVL